MQLVHGGLGDLGDAFKVTNEVDEAIEFVDESKTIDGDELWKTFESSVEVLNLEELPTDFELSCGDEVEAEMSAAPNDKKKTKKTLKIILY